MDIKIDVSWFRFLADLPPMEIKKIIRAIWDYTHGEENISSDSAAWETIKSSIDLEKRLKEERSEKRRRAALVRWERIHAQQKPTEAPLEPVEPEIVKPQNKFMPLTDDSAIRAELEKPTSALSVFLETGSGYDELTPAERDFADRGDVRKNCTWHKEIQAATRALKTKLPSEQEVLEYARQQNSIAGMGGFACSDEEALNFYDYYSGIGWVMPNDSRTPIVNWKPFLRKWVRNPLRPQNKFRMSIKDIKEMQKEEELQKMLRGER